jgi:large subunit ribosomal protein L31
MKKDIHPKLHRATVKCACGNTFETMSTLENITVEICSACHPFYTGKRKFVDTEGRIDVFKKRMEKASSKKQAVDAKKSTEKNKSKTQEKPADKTLKEMLAEIRAGQPEEKPTKEVVRKDKIEESKE